MKVERNSALGRLAFARRTSSKHGGEALILVTGGALVALVMTGGDAKSQLRREPTAPAATAAPAAASAPATASGVAVNRGLVTRPVAQQNNYTFTLRSFNVTNTRSLHNDSDYVAVAVSVNGQPAIAAPTVFIDGVNNGQHTVNLSLPAVAVGATQRVAFSYSILNKGHAADGIETALSGAVEAAAAKAGAAGGSYVGGPTGGVVGSAAGGWLGKKLANILFADCDGSVAAGDHVLDQSQLAALTANPTTTTTDNNPGTDSATGCGSNSHYYVTWSVSKTVSQVMPMAR